MQISQISQSMRDRAEQFRAARAAYLDAPNVSTRPVEESDRLRDAFDLAAQIVAEQMLIEIDRASR